MSEKPISKRILSTQAGTKEGYGDQITRQAKILKADLAEKIETKRQTRGIGISLEDSHLRYNLQLDPNKAYADEDLGKANTLQHAVRLLYTARTGEGFLRTHSGVHIDYTHLDSAQWERVAVEMDVIKTEVSLFYIDSRV